MTREKIEADSATAWLADGRTDSAKSHCQAASGVGSHFHHYFDFKCHVLFYLNGNIYNCKHRKYKGLNGSDKKTEKRV